MNQASFVIRPLRREDRDWVAHLLDDRWGSTQLVSRGESQYGHLLPGFVAERPLPPEGGDRANAPIDDDETEENPAVRMEKIGLLTYNVTDKECEIVTLDSMEEGIGVGTALVDALKAAAKENKLERLWLVTTNDNLAALRFWQKREFYFVAIHVDAIAEARRMKPQIPIIGLNGIPIRDELELAYSV